MAVSSLLKIISERCVEPSSPTPPSRRYYKFSSLDQDMVDALVSVAFFYPKQGFHSPKGSTELCQLLETSLSKVLVYYYPFAGRKIDNNSVDCNDTGVQLWEVQIQASMSEILDQPDNHAKDLVFPRGLFLNNSVTAGHLLMIQLNHFECGGIGIGVCISHKIGDAQTICNFINDWAAMARGSPEVPSPQLAGASVFPPFARPSSKPSNITSTPKSCVTRRFVFSASRISKLKAMVAADSGIQNPSKVEVATALIFKSAMAAGRANSDSFRPSLLAQSANIRAITIPPLPENYVGNFVNTFLISATKEKETKTVSGLVGELRKSKLQFQNRHRKSLKGNELSLQISKDWEDLRKKSGSNNFDAYVFTSWCRFPFYKVDFGWGKPIFVCIPSSPMKNIIILMDTQSGDGIEAFVTLEEAEMSLFEHDEEFLAFASLNPKTWEVNA